MDATQEFRNLCQDILSNMEANNASLDLVGAYRRGPMARTKRAYARAKSKGDLSLADRLVYQRKIQECERIERELLRATFALQDAGITTLNAALEFLGIQK